MAFDKLNDILSDLKHLVGSFQLEMKVLEFCEGNRNSGYTLGISLVGPKITLFKFQWIRR